jgi:hypothetical protein
VTSDELGRFQKRIAIDPATGCWLWAGAKSSGKYGSMTVGSKTDGTRRTARVHRLAYEHFAGPIPDGLCVCHACDVPACVNPEHLWLGTYADNNSDRNAKHRQRFAVGEAHGKSKLTAGDVRVMRDMRSRGATYPEIAGRFGINRHTIRHAVLGHTWSHVEAGC